MRNENVYRLNVRFQMDDPREREAAEYLQNHRNRNRFIVEAVLAAIPAKENTREEALLTEEGLRRILQETFRSIPVEPRSSEPSAFQTVDTELTEEEQQKNNASVLDDLETLF